MRDEVALVFSNEWPRLPQFYRVADLGVPLVQHGQSIDRFLERLNHGLGRGEFRQISQCVRVFKFHLPVEKFSLNKRFDLAIQDIVAADQSQILHHCLREIADHTAIVRDTCCVQDRGMRHLSSGDILEDNFPLLFLGELQVGYALMQHCGDIERAQVLIFPVDARRQHGDFDVQSLHVLFGVFVVDLHHQRSFGLHPFPHRLPFQHYAFRLNGFHKLHKGIRANDTDVFFHITGIHFAQAAPKGLFGQYVALRGIGA